jgi:hypothetical protein
MEMKTFYFRIFKKRINPDYVEYWNLLLAVLIYRLKSVEELNRTCTSCFTDKFKLQHLLDQMIDEGIIDKLERSKNFYVEM